MDKSLETVKNELKKLGFFKYCKNENEVIEEVFKNYKNDGRIHFSNRLNRLIAFEHYQIYELRGVLDFVENEFQPILKLRGQEIKIGECIENQDDSGNYTERTIEINGKLHDIRGDNGWCWTRTFMATHKMIDNVLSEFEKEEKIYGLYFDSINCFLIADEPLFEYLKNLIPEGEQMYPKELMDYYAENYSVFLAPEETIDSSDWRQVLPILYDNLRLESGQIQLKKLSRFSKRKFVKEIIIEFETNEFEYVDPLYGRQSSKAPFKIYMQIDTDWFESIKVSSFQDLESKEFHDDTQTIWGSFSNSIGFTTPRLKFGKINNKKIDFEMDFILTNSDSYPLMNDDIEEHSELSGTLKTELKILNKI